jgi:hypothetical protein
VQPGRGRRHRTRRSDARRREHGLVALAIGGLVRVVPRLAADVRRQRHLAAAHRQGCQPVAGIGTGVGVGVVLRLARACRRHRHEPVVVTRHDHQLRARLVDHVQRLSGPQAPRRPGHRPPGAGRRGRLRLHEQDLDAPAGVRAPAPQPGRQHAALVEHEQVAGAQQTRQCRERGFTGNAAAVADQQQARAVAMRRRLLRDQLRRQVELECGVAVVHAPLA